MQRVQKKDQFIAPLKRPGKDDWREKLARNQKNAPAPAPYVQPTTPYLPERQPGQLTTLRGMVTFGLFANAVYAATQLRPDFSGTVVENPGNTRVNLK